MIFVLQKKRKEDKREKITRYPKKVTEIIDMVQQVCVKHMVMDLHWCRVTKSSIGRANFTERVNQEEREGEVHEGEPDWEREAHEGNLHRVEEVYRDSEGE